MKNKYLLIFIVGSFININLSNAQVSELISGLNFPLGIGVHDNHLYTNDYGDTIKLDLSASNPTPEVVMEGLGSVSASLLFNGCDLYVAAPGPYAVFYADICAPDPDMNQIFQPTTAPQRIAIIGEYMYIIYSSSTWCGYLRDTVERVNYAQPAGFEVVISGLGCLSSLAVRGNDLFVADLWNDNVVKIDITDSNPSPVVVVSGIDEPSALTIVDDFLYIGSWTEKKIYRIDVTLTNPVLENVTSPLCCAPANLIEHDNFLYMSQPFAGKITKVDLLNLSTEEFDNKQLVIYPNPSGDFIQVRGITFEKKYKITNLLGVTILDGTLGPENQIDIGELRDGIYFILFEAGVSTKFIKKS